MRKNRAGLKKNGFRMMTLDDDPIIIESLRAYFESSGYQVDTETDPVRALERMKETQYDILLLDFIMQPFCGDVFVSRLRQFDPKVFVILLTGHRELAPPLNTIRELDIQGYYEKNERFDQLELLVESCIKAIKQMRIIGKYQDGLSQIISAMPHIHQLIPIENTVDQISRHLAAFCDSEDSFVQIYPGRMDGYSDALNLPEIMYRGNGRFAGDFETIERDLSMDMKVDIEASLTFNKAVQSDAHIIAPLLNPGKGHSRSYGVIGVSKSSEQTDAIMPLVSVYAEQTSTALHNTLLHVLLNQQNEKLSEAYGQLKNSYMQTIEAIRVMVDAKDIYTRGHSDRVSYYAHRLSLLISDDPVFHERVRVAGLLHDVGKVGVSDAILTKNASLTQAEFDAIKQHTDIGASMLERINLVSDLAPIVCAHHENYDGTGYPNGLQNEGIPIEARIITIADAFDAMMSDRHYRSHLSLERAIKQLIQGKGTQFDGVLVDHFLTIAKQYDDISKELAWTYR